MPAHRRQKALRPVTVGNVTLRLYQRSDGRVLIVYGADRKQRTFSSEIKARDAAQRIARELHNGGTDSQTFSAADRAEYAHCKRLTFGSRHSLPDIVQAGLRTLTCTLHNVPGVISELIASKQTKDLNSRYRRGLTSTLQAFGAVFPDPIEHINASQIEHYLAGLNKGTRRRDNILQEIRHLFHFARLRGYIADNITEAGKVASIHRIGGDIGIFTPEEISIFLEHVSPEWLPYLAFAAFSGVRTEELALSKDAAQSKDPLRWKDIDWDECEICIRAETSKTGKPRRCPLLPNLQAWIEPLRHSAHGPIAPAGKRPDREFGRGGRLLRFIGRLQARQLAPALERVEWRHNGLRHSYGSYRMAMIRNMHQLSYEMGNSVGMISRHYHNPRPLSEARAWFNVMPPSPGNVVQLDFVVA